MVIVRNAFAKVNLYLEITGRRQDGYHSLRMLNQSVSLADKLTLAQGTGGLTLSCDAPNVPTDEHNLVIRAARLFLEASGMELPSGGFHFILEKKIPSQAGLGGGSADAAAALLMLSEWYGEPLPRPELFRLAADLGADVPFALLNGTAEVSGKGEQLRPLPLLTSGAFLIAKPDAGISTKEAFAAYDRAPVPPRGDYISARQALAAGDLLAFVPLVFNHFEALSPDPMRDAAEEAMRRAGALGAALTGSGSAVFGLFPDEKAARKAKQLLGSDPAVADRLRFLAVAVPCSGKQPSES